MSDKISEFPCAKIFSEVGGVSASQGLFLRDQQNYIEQRGQLEVTEEGVQARQSLSINRGNPFIGYSFNVHSSTDEIIDSVVHSTLDNVIEQAVSETERNASKQKPEGLSEISLKYADEYEILKCGEEEGNESESNVINTGYRNQQSFQAYNNGFNEGVEKETVVIEDSSSDFLPHTCIQVATNLFRTVQSCITFLIRSIILWIFIKEVAKINSPIFNFFTLEKDTKATKIENDVGDDLNDDKSEPNEKPSFYFTLAPDTNAFPSIVNNGYSINDVDKYKSDKNNLVEYPRINSEIDEYQDADEEEDNILDHILNKNNDLIPIDEEVNMHDYIFDGNDDPIPTGQSLSFGEDYPHYSYFENEFRGNEIINGEDTMHDYFSDHSNELLPIEQGSLNCENNQSIGLKCEEDYMQDSILERNTDLISAERNLQEDINNESIEENETKLVASVPKRYCETSANLISKLPQKRIRVTSMNEPASLQKVKLF